MRYISSRAIKRSYPPVYYVGSPYFVIMTGYILIECLFDLLYVNLFWEYRWLLITLIIRINILNIYDIILHLPSLTVNFTQAHVIWCCIECFWGKEGSMFWEWKYVPVGDDWESGSQCDQEWPGVTDVWSHPSHCGTRRHAEKYVLERSKFLPRWASCRSDTPCECISPMNAHTSAKSPTDLNSLVTTLLSVSCSLK